VVGGVGVDIMENKVLTQKRLPRRLETEKPRITLIIPALNEEKNLPHLLPKIPPIVDEVLLVDGRSTDRTLAVARELRPNIRILSQDGRGKGNAIKCGIKHATGDIVVMIDADVSMDPEEIPCFIEPLLNGFDYVKGSRFLTNGGTTDMESYRRFANKVFIFLVNRFFKGKYTDLCYGYNAFWRDTFQAMEITSDGFEIETEMNIKALKAGLKVAEIPSYEEPRLNGVSNLKSFRDGIRILRTIFRLRFGKTHQFRNCLEAERK
jgi:glycosyltransferase involved in cell wall biosynthesis